MTSLLACIAFVGDVASLIADIKPLGLPEVAADR
jgi:hypothetical protein